MKERILNNKFNDYFNGFALFGSEEKCLKIIEGLALVGVNDIACLIDFGLNKHLVLEHFHKIASLCNRLPEYLDTCKAKSKRGNKYKRSEIANFQTHSNSDLSVCGLMNGVECRKALAFDNYVNVNLIRKYSNNYCEKIITRLMDGYLYNYINFNI